MSAPAAELELEPDTPPPAGKAPKAPKAPPKPRTRKPRGKPSLAPQVQAFLEFGGGIWAISDDVCGPALVELAPELAAGLDAWAQSNPKVYKAVESMFEVGGGASFALGCVKLATVIGKHHLEPALERIRDRRAGFEPEPDLELAEELGAVYREPAPAPEPAPDAYTYDPDADPTRIREGT